MNNLIGKMRKVTNCKRYLFQDDDNIPLRVMLLLVDEVFDLKNRDQWLRRQVETLLRQIIKAAFGTKINSKIIEGVETITSPAHVAELVKRFK